MTRRITTLLAAALALLLALAPAALATEVENGVTFSVDSLPIVTEPITVRVAASRHPLTVTEFNDMPVYQELEKNTGVHVEWDLTQSDSWTQKKALMFASGDLPDAIFSLSDDDLLNYGPQGMLIPLNDLIDKYCPNVKRIFAERPELERICTSPDGNIYSFPYAEEQMFMNNPDNMFINKQWLEALNLEMPTTYAELLEVLRAFKDKDPNGNGQADEIPFVARHDGTGNTQNTGLYSLFGWFGTLDNPNHIGVEDGKVYFTANTEGYKQALKFFNQMYQEGLLDAETFTADINQYQAKIKSEPNIVGCFMEFSPESFMTVEDSAAKYVVLPPLKGVDGETRWNVSVGIHGRGSMGITKNAKNPAVLARWADAMLDPWVSLEIDKGIFGGGLYKTEDGKWGFNPPPEGKTKDEIRFNETGCQGPRVMLSEMFEVLENPNPVAALKAERYEIYKPFFPEQIYPKLLFTLEQSQQLDALKTDINTYVTKMTAQFILQGDVDGGWDNYVNTLNQMGLPEMVTIYQDAHDTYYQQ